MKTNLLSPISETVKNADVFTLFIGTVTDISVTVQRFAIWRAACKVGMA